MIRAYNDLPESSRFTISAVLGAMIGFSWSVGYLTFPQMLLATGLLIFGLNYAEIVQIFAWGYFNAGQTDRAFLLCNHGLNLAPRNYALLTTRSAVYLRRGQLDDALADIELVIAIRPKTWQAFSNKAAVYCDLHRYDESLSAAEQALELKPSSRAPRAIRAIVKLARHELEVDTEDLEALNNSRRFAPIARFLKMNSYWLSSKIDLANKLAEEIGENPAPASIDSLALCTFKFFQHQRCAVLEICAHVPDNSAYAYSFLVLQSFAYRGLNEGELALSSLRRAISLGSHRSAAFLARALILSDAGYLDQALIDCERGRELSKGNNLREAEAYLHQCNGRYEQMLECTQGVIDKLPDYAGGRAMHSLALSGLGRLDEAIEEATRATKLLKFEAAGWYALAEAQQKLGRLDEALTSITAGLAEDPDYRCSYRKRSELYRMLGREPEAAADLAKFQQLEAQFLARITPALWEDEILIVHTSRSV